MSNLPYSVYGTITDTDATNPDGAKVVLRNDTNGETTTTTTNASGKYLVDAANFTSGYLETDGLTVICGYGNADNQSSFLISSDTHNVDLTLTTIEESGDLTYTQVQDVLDELGDKTTTDIAYKRVRRAILWAESRIEERTDTTFKPTLVTDEIYDFNQYTSHKSPEQLTAHSSDLQLGTRNDYQNSNFNDSFRLEKSPIINPKTQLNGDITAAATTLTVDSTSDFPTSGTLFIYNSTNGTEQINYTGITSTTFTGCTRSANSTTATAHVDGSYVRMIRLSKNIAGQSAEDNWSDIEPQSGGGGDFLFKNDLAMVTFVNNCPSQGARKIKTSYSYGYVLVPKIVEELATYLAIRRIVTSKGTDSEFSDVNAIALTGYAETKGIVGTTGYLRWLDDQINGLWNEVGQFVNKTV